MSSGGRRALRSLPHAGACACALLFVFLWQAEGCRDNGAGPSSQSPQTVSELVFAAGDSLVFDTWGLDPYNSAVPASRTGAVLALANKESVVCTGDLMLRTVAQAGGIAASGRATCDASRPHVPPNSKRHGAGSPTQNDRRPTNGPRRTTSPDGLPKPRRTAPRPGRHSRRRSRTRKRPERHGRRRAPSSTGVRARARPQVRQPPLRRVVWRGRVAGSRRCKRD